MSLLWHIVQKDLRRLGRWLALLVGVLLGRYAHFCSVVATENVRFNDWETHAIIDSVMLGLALFVSACAAATLVHEDAVTSDRAFWFTRPISGLRLLTAKLTTLVIALVLVPLALQISWWGFNHYSFTEITAQLPTMLARHSGTAVAAFFFALLTRNLGNFVLATLLGLLAIAASFATCAFILPDDRFTNSETQRYLQLALALLAACACIFWQYRTRHTRQTLVIAGSALIGALCIQIFWRWPLFDQPNSFFAQLPSLASDPAITAQITAVTPSTFTYTPSYNGKPSVTRPALIVKFTLANLAPSHALQLYAPSGTDQELAPYFNAPLIFRLPHEADRSLSAHSTLIYNPADTRPSKITLNLHLRETKEVARLPLKTEAHARTGAYVSTITDWQLRSVRPARSSDSRVATTVFEIDLRETRPSHLINSFGDSTNNLGEWSSAYVLISDHAAIPCLPGYKQGSRFSLSVDGVVHQRTSLQFPIELKPDDLPRYTLVKLITPALGTFTRTLPLPPMP